MPWLVPPHERTAFLVGETGIRAPGWHCQATYCFSLVRAMYVLLAPAFAIDQPMRVGLDLSESVRGIGGVGERGREGKGEEGLEFLS